MKNLLRVCSLIYSPNFPRARVCLCSLPWRERYSVSEQAAAGGAGALTMSAGLVVNSLLELRVHASSGRSYWAFFDATAANESAADADAGQMLGAAERAFSARLYLEARGIYRELARRQPELALVHRRLGAIEMVGERAAAAVTHLETALRLQPGSHHAVLELAEAHRQQGRPAVGIWP